MIIKKNTHTHNRRVDVKWIFGVLQTLCRYTPQFHARWIFFPSTFVLFIRFDDVVSRTHKQKMFRFPTVMYGIIATVENILVIRNMSFDCRYRFVFPLSFSSLFVSQTHRARFFCSFVDFNSDEKVSFYILLSSFFSLLFFLQLFSFLFFALLRIPIIIIDCVY